METKLTSKGYAIPNNPKNIECIKKDLVVKPFVLPDYDFNNKPFSVYRRNNNYIYLPKYYGIDKYGVPKIVDERKGDDISIKFKGKLRESQLEVANGVINTLNNKGSTLLSLQCGGGKCLAFDTDILMYNGEIKKVQDIEVGDKIMGDDSKPRNILKLGKGEEEMFEIIPTKGESYTVNKSHILSLKYNTGKRKGEIIDISVLDYLKLPSYNPLVGFRVPINFKEQDVKLDPYLLGLWLGDGSSYKINEDINELNLKKNKHIPLSYKCNSRNNRMRLLAGIIDSGGLLTHSKNEYEIIQKNYKLSEDIKYLCRSLGFACYIIKSCRIRIYGLGIEHIPCLVPRKKANHEKQIKNVLNYKFKIIPKGIGNYYGFEIDGNKRFVLGTFDVTHNTVISLYISSIIGKKTLVIVHKEFLLNQWIERIKQFLPDARIGRIQQNVVDIEDKDIVIAMLQSITVRKIPYPKETFDSFGFTLMDECIKYNQLIITENGPIKIGILYKMWKNNKILPLLLSYNEKLDIFEYKTITHSWEKEKLDLLKIQYLGGDIECTDNHLILTSNGYIEAGKLKVGDLIKCKGINKRSNTTKIINIQNIKNEGEGYNGKVYDLEIEDNHNFVLYTGPIVHNCHRICSKTFSKALFQISTAKSLGLSATPDRKDGLSKVLSWFLGEFTIPDSKDEELFPDIKTIVAEYSVQPVISYNILGKVNLPGLVTTISLDLDRNKQILNEIKEARKENRNILVLSERRQQCTDLLNMLPNSISGGLYVGGMKSEDLDTSNTKDVVFATYSMAHEGYDNSRLDTLIMATGRTSVEQACGRILRKKNKNNPLIIDFQDEIEGLKGQGKSRIRYYKQKKYKFLNNIKETKSINDMTTFLFLDDDE